MKKIINTAPMAVITTQHTPPTLSLTLKPVGQDATLTQAQDVAKNLWLPDRTINPLFIVPVFDAYDPDTKEHIAATPSYKWYVNGVVVPSTNTPADDFYIVTVPQSDAGIIVGTLAVRKNTSYLVPLTIKCEATFQTYTEDSEVLLTSENKPDVFYRIDLKTPAVVEYRPLTDDSTQKSFQAFVQHGDEALVWDDVVGKSINAVDLGSLTWNMTGSTFYATLSTKAKTDGGAALAGYTQDQDLAEDKTISTSTGNIRIKDAAYSTAAELKAAMDGKVLFYELATKTVQESFEEAMRKMTGFFWYLDTYGYVSGQGMETLVLDADYIDGSTISVRLAVPTFTDDGVTMPTSPTAPACAQSYLTWSWDEIDVMAIALGGSHVHQYSSQKEFSSVARINGKDMDSSRRSHIRAVWYTHDTDAPSTAKEYGYHGTAFGEAVDATIPAAALWRTGKVNVEVGLELYLKGYLHLVTDEETGTTSMARTETKIENKAPLAIIHSTNSALTVSLTLKPVGQDATLTQAQDVTKSLWIPDRTISALFIEPVLSAYDPDAKQPVTISPMYEWSVNGVTVPRTNTASSNYYIIPATSEDPEKLVVRKNTSYTSPDVIRCVATYADSLNTQTLTKDAEILLTTENKPEAVYMVDIAAPAPIVFRPFSDATSQKSLSAFAQYGDVRLHNEVKYFWYVDDNLIDNETVGYISGQGTEALVIDLDLFKDMVISVRLGVPVGGTMPAEPNLNAMAQRLITWDYEDIEFIPVGLGGSAVRVSSGDKDFDVVVRVNGKDISKEKIAKYTRMSWFTHDTNADQNDVADKGWGPSLTLTNPEMFRSASVNVEVGIEPYVLGQFKKVVDDATGFVVVDDATGAVVIANG